MATCRIHQEYPNHILIPCQNSALPGDPKGLCILHSQDDRKDQVAFRAALSARWQQEDSEYQDFRAVFFPCPFDPQNFWGTPEFNKRVDFSLAIFFEGASFSRTIFKQFASFSGATFNKVAIFDNANFANGANFSRATFTDGASFSGATFKEGVYFSYSTFNGPLVFGMAKIFGQVLFQFINQSGKVFDGYFGDLELSSKAILRFQDLSLAQVRFSSTGLRQVEFDHVTWASRWGRTAVYNEILLHQQRWAHIAYVLQHGGIWGKRIPGAKGRPEKPSYAEFAQVERLYRQLKINYEEERDFKRVGDFHYGEMEMHRRESKWRRWLSWYSIYYVLSGYGERPRRALVWLMAFLFGLSGLVWWLGLSVDDYGNMATPWDSVVYILQKASLQRPEWPKPYGFWARFWSSLSVLLIPGQAALFLLALRNRLGRRR